MKKLIAGNWKMNTNKAEGTALVQALENGLNQSSCDVLICPPFPYLGLIKDNLKSIALGAQDCSWESKGAFTGDTSPAMLKELGCAYVILGHSERRQYHKESDELVAKKAASAHTAGLTTIVCVGETLSEREGGKAETIVTNQLALSLPVCATVENTVIAYEPVWAIGTGKTATTAEIAAMHAFIRAELAKKFNDAGKIRILYGGSVKGANAAEILSTANVDGALVGGASLVADEFLKICTSAPSQG